MRYLTGVLFFCLSFYFVNAYGQMSNDLTVNAVFFNVEKANNDLLIKYSDLSSNSSTIDPIQDSVLLVGKQINILLENLKGHLTNAKKNYLSAINDYTGSFSKANLATDTLALSILKDIKRDLEIKNEDYKIVAGLNDPDKPLNTEEIPFKILTVKFIDDKGNSINVKGYKIRANTWRNRDNQIPQFNFNEQFTNPFLKLSLLPGEYDIWAENAQKKIIKKHSPPQNGMIIKYAVKDSIIKIIIPK